MPAMPDSLPTEPSESPSPGNRRGPEIDILVTSPLWGSHASRQDLRQAANEALSIGCRAELGCDFGGTELAIELADDRRVAGLNARFRGKRGATNVLSFPAVEPGNLEAALRQARGSARPLPLGDVSLAYETVRREAEGRNMLLAHHLAHLVVHGVLHCLGYDHQGEEEAEIMEALERQCLAQLGIPDPYAVAAPAGGDEG